jgi:hypothetical protein
LRQKIQEAELRSQELQELQNPGTSVYTEIRETTESGVSVNKAPARQSIL